MRGGIGAWLQRLVYLSKNPPPSDKTAGSKAIAAVSVCDVGHIFEKYGLDADKSSSESRRKAMEELESWAISGEQEAQESLADLYAEQGPLRDPSKAYFWFQIAFSFKGNGYSTEFRNKDKSPLYCGPVGDFRNEAQVCELVDELGLAQIQRIDQEARAWLQAFQNSLDVQS